MAPKEAADTAASSSERIESGAAVVPPLAARRAEESEGAHLQAIIDRLHGEAASRSAKIGSQQHEILEQKAIAERLHSDLAAVRAQVPG